MRRYLAFFMILAVALLAGCGSAVDREAASTPAPTPDADILPAQEVAAADPNFFDVDLTGMNATMIYSCVFSIVNDPAEYIGQHFRIEGTYQTSSWSATGSTYHFVVVMDATACCAQGLEFMLDEGLSYPAEGDQIELTGTFGSYEELDETYYYIQADSIRTVE